MAKVESDETSPTWHPGEAALQASVGMAQTLASLGPRLIQDRLRPQQQAALAHLPFVIVGAVDPHGAPWASLVTGRSGFISAPNDRRLWLATSRDRSDPTDSGLEDGDAIGLLGIDLETRQRTRVNGQIRRTGDDAFEVRAQQAYGNCPQYIQRREVMFHRDPRKPSTALADHLPVLDAEARAAITTADTFFVASYVDREDGARQVDVSHRGGKPGFVQVDEHGVLTVPDFAGNRFFNTLGNLWSNPKAGLLFVDFERGDTLQMTGQTELVLDSPRIAAFQGAERLWRFIPRQIVRRRDTLALRWIADRNGQSRNCALTGDWPTAAETLAAQALGSTWRPFKVTRVVEESWAIRSIFLEPTDGAGLVAPQAGQNIAIRLTPRDIEGSYVRRYCLSTAPSDGTYRISVQRQGKVSRHLQETLKVGDTLDVQAPAGAFAFDASDPRPAMLLAAGIGVAPMIAMLRQAAYKGARTRTFRPTWLIYAAQRLVDRAFDAELAALVAAGHGALHLTRLLADLTGAQAGRDYDLVGDIDAGLLNSLPLGGDEVFYLCGSLPFMQAIYDALRALGVPDADIRAQAFEPADLARRPDAPRSATA